MYEHKVRHDERRDRLYDDRHAQRYAYVVSAPYGKRRIFTSCEVDSGLRPGDACGRPRGDPERDIVAVREAAVYPSCVVRPCPAFRINDRVIVIAPSHSASAKTRPELNALHAGYGKDHVAYKGLDGIKKGLAEPGGQPRDPARENTSYRVFLAQGLINGFLNVPRPGDLDNFGFNPRRFDEFLSDHARTNESRCEPAGEMPSAAVIIEPAVFPEGGEISVAGPRQISDLVIRARIDICVFESDQDRCTCCSPVHDTCLYEGDVRLPPAGRALRPALSSVEIGQEFAFRKLKPRRATIDKNTDELPVRFPEYAHPE